MSFNPYKTTAEQFAEIIARHNELHAGQGTRLLTQHDIISIPNGQQYGKDGHIPCDHEAHFYYEDGSCRIAYSVGTGGSYAILWK